MQRTLCNVQPTACNMQRTICNMQQTTRNGQYATCDVHRTPHQTTCNRQLRRPCEPIWCGRLYRRLPSALPCSPKHAGTPTGHESSTVAEAATALVGWGLKGLRQGAYQRDGLRGVDAVLHERAARARLDDLLDHRRADAEPDVARRYTRLREVEEVVVIHACSTAAGGGSSQALVQHAGGRCVCTRGLGYQAASEACRAASRCRRCKGSSGRTDGQGCRPCCTLHTLQR